MEEGNENKSVAIIWSIVCFMNWLNQLIQTGEN